MTNNEDLIGGCCVCSDDQGFSNNVLVYCDGKGCTVACHTACYGIVSIPDGEWLCRRCEAEEVKAPCRLCPMIDGAMKRTSDGDWAHVVCALYIPEVSFGNNETMEPIILSNIPSTRFGQICTICIKNGRSNSDAIKGACCECTVKNCSQVFHVTCAQQTGLLYEDVRKNNCQYIIYCEQHQPKYSKFIRQIPAFQYKPLQIKYKSKAKIDQSQLSDFVNTQELSSKKIHNKTSQNSSKIISPTNLSEFIKLNKDERNSISLSNQTQSIIDNRELLSNKNLEQESLASTCTNNHSNDNINLPSKIKTEENDIDYQIIEKIQLNKKRHHSNDDSSKTMSGRSSSKKTLLSHEKLKIEESLIKNNQILNTQQKQENRFPPETLEEFLEQEWESTSDFLLQQTMPHDVSSLLSCLYQFKSENADLEKKFNELKHRRDSLRVSNVNLRQKISDVLTINNSQYHSMNNNQYKSSSSTATKISSSHIGYLPNNSNFSSYETINPYTTIIKNEQIPSTNNLSLELLSQILTTNGPQLFAPTWNISNFGYANFPGANSISISDESIIRSYPSFEQ